MADGSREPVRGESSSSRVAASGAAARLRYAVITPARNEAGHIRRLGAELAAQTLVPASWIVVDTGSMDATVELANELATELPWVSVLRLALGPDLRRGAPIVKAFHAGLAHRVSEYDIVAKLDADVSVEPDHYQRIVSEFERNPSLGITGGILYERDGRGDWRRRHGTGAGVWGADRAYRRDCLETILPLEERMGWDTVDLIAAEVHGWNTRPVADLPFLHLRAEGARESSRFAHWAEHGRAAHFMGYRLSYLAVRMLFRSLQDPAAVGIIWGYADATLRGEPRCADASVRAFIRNKQRLRQLPFRAREALRRRAALEDRP